MRFPDKLYDVLKWIAVIVIPAIITFLSTVLPLVGVDVELTKTIVTIIAACDTLLGALIGISTLEYNKEK